LKVGFQDIGPFAVVARTGRNDKYVPQAYLAHPIVAMLPMLRVAAQFVKQ